MPTVARSPDSHKKRKKPPACDPCKSRRVLCHPKLYGNSCPRCREKGIVCTTTPVTRGRPRKKPLASPDIAPSQSSGSGQIAKMTDLPLLGSSSKTPYETVLDPAYTGPLAPTASDIHLCPELVRHLFECFTQLPQNSHPIFRGVSLRYNLAALSWNIDHLPPQPRVLAYCVCALASSIAFDPAVLGPGPRPTSFTDHSVFMRGADLRAYGVRRAPVVRTLHARALRLACEAGVLLEATEDNAASCAILELLDRENEATSRPWAGAYLSHVRTLAAFWDDMDVSVWPLWAGFLMAEALSALSLRKPVLVTHNDQLLITGAPPLSLDQLLDSLQVVLQPSTKQSIGMVFAVTRPFMFHVTRLARDLFENITGDYARRQPLSDTAVMRFLAELTTLRRIRELVLSEFESALLHEHDANGDSFATRPFFYISHHARRSHGANVRGSAHAMNVGYTSLVLALHEEMVFRSGQQLADCAGDDAMWARERIALLARQVRELAQRTVRQIVRGLEHLPSLPLLTHLHAGGFHGWARLCLEDDTDPDGAVAETCVVLCSSSSFLWSWLLRRVAFRIAGALKLIGYSWDLPASSALIARLEAHIAERRVLLHHADSVDFAHSAQTGFMQANGSDCVADGSALDMQFSPPLDDGWMTMFTSGGTG
ncbi:hypothetical protein B0H10DRAFT_2185707 [Mycena sp. CBHHK59/15]|nr:hypothetical protein B0H10DRAFT_2185707 [Mycena sp. CBHHK59/15]